MKKQPFYFRCVGFNEVFDLLDLDRYDDILIDKLHGINNSSNARNSHSYHERSDRRYNEPIENGYIEVLEGSNIHKSSDKKRSCGVMPVRTARDKFL